MERELLIVKDGTVGPDLSPALVHKRMNVFSIAAQLAQRGGADERH